MANAAAWSKVRKAKRTGRWRTGIAEMRPKIIYEPCRAPRGGMKSHKGDGKAEKAQGTADALTLEQRWRNYNNLSYHQSSVQTHATYWEMCKEAVLEGK